MSTSVVASFDCERCTIKQTCGKLPTPSLWGCFDHCLNSCNPETCDFTCPHNHKLYSARWSEVEGRGPAPVSDIKPIPESWPAYVPTVLGKYKRGIPAAAFIVALPLARLFRRRSDGELEPVASNPLELRRRFMLRDDARIMAVGVAPDKDIERLWHYHVTAGMGAALLKMGVELATAPNYSHFVYAPRTHYVWNRKRMLLFANRLGAEGFPVVPHLYAETDFDYDRFADIYHLNPSLNAVAIELQTADAEKLHAEELARQLVRFTARVGRPIHAFVMGGRHALPWLAPLFSSLTVVENSAYIKTIKSRLAHRQGERLRWSSSPTKSDLVALFDHNTRISAEVLSVQLAAARARMGKTGTAAA